jgi:predicted DNA-binding transcriptional regulator AlpA
MPPLNAAMNSTVKHSASAEKRAGAGLKPVQPVEVATVAGAWLTWPTLQKLSGLSVRTLRRHMAEDPAFPPLIRIGGAARFRAGDVERWMSSHMPAAK